MRWKIFALIFALGLGNSLADTRAAEPVSPDAAGAETESPEVSPGTTLPDAVAPEIVDTKDLKRLVAGQIDVMDVEDLMKKMARAQAVLGLEGQILLKNRASLRRQHDRAESIVKRIEGDPLVTDAQALFANEGFRSELAAALELPTEEQMMTAIAEILQQNRVDTTTLKKMGHAQQWGEYRDLYAAGLAGIENRIRRVTRRIGDAQGKADVEYPVGLVELAKKYAQEEAEVASPSAMPVDDLKGLLKKLLGSDPAAATE